MESSRYITTMKTYFVYILSNHRRTVYYVGVTNNLARRFDEHRAHCVPGFTDRYNCTELVYFEETSDINMAITREKQLKKWGRTKKLTLIQSVNPDIRDLSTSLEMTSYDER